MAGLPPSSKKGMWSTTTELSSSCLLLQGFALNCLPISTSRQEDAGFVCAGAYSLRFQEPMESIPSQGTFRKSGGELPTGPLRGIHTTVLGKCYKLGPFPVFLEEQLLSSKLPSPHPAACVCHDAGCSALPVSSTSCFLSRAPQHASHMFCLAPAKAGH